MATPRRVQVGCRSRLQFIFKLTNRMRRRLSIRTILRAIRRRTEGFPPYFLLFVVTILVWVTAVPGIAAIQSAPPAENRAASVKNSPSPPISQTLGDVSGIIEHGFTLYQSGRFSEAAAIWSQAVEASGRQADWINQALSLSYLSLAYQKLGDWRQAERAIALSLDRLAAQPSLGETGLAVLAQVLNTQGGIQLAMGRPEAAFDTWRRAADAYAQQGDSVGLLGSQINQAQALQTAGLYRRAQTLLRQVDAQLQAQPDSILKALALKSLGAVWQVTGSLEKSKGALERSLKISRRLDPPLAVSDTLFNLANTLRALKDTDTALDLYQQAAAAAPTAISRLNAQLNQLGLLIETEQWPEALAAARQIQPQLRGLAPSRRAIYAQVNFAASLMQIADQPSRESALSSSSLFAPETIAQILSTAVQQARVLQDPRAESYALGQLGSLYEQIQQWQAAKDLTQQALTLAQTSNASDIAYGWQWQLGRVLKHQADQVEASRSLSGNDSDPLREQAISAYTDAFETLRSIRKDLLATNPEIQFSFREGVEPIYRELVELLLRADTRPANLQKAREVIEDLQLAKLENFFRSACLEPLRQIDQIDQKAAVVYPILLSDRLEVIISLPGQPLRHYATPVEPQQVETLVADLRQNLILPYTSDKDINPLSHQIYTWLIQPAEAALAESSVETLVFVLDDAFRNIPMTALYDGQQYLVEKYNVALTLGLQLFEPKPLAQIKLRALTAGLSQSRHDFPPLDFVELELTQIKSEIPGEVLLNQEFTSDHLASLIESSSFPMVHIATHGQFSSQSDKTFILAWDQPITVNQLDTFLKAREQSQAEALELLVLSACETADGDERAALGLAGVAVQAGARSTLASLWLVDDESTALLMREFYHGLNAGLTKAEALRQAQITLLRGNYHHPRFWAAFVMLGNWL
ncbi:MAG: CHAT domain-containing protein [Leptolyngbyaceae cyanobacterium MO_188.B28]|nr:CHAT domain-containing protein [Leptolyngbyaceae cyanobacterium MO_188.B28]